MFHKKIDINGRSVGTNFAPYVVAELSANHNGDLECAFKSIEAAKQAGADAIKIQTYTPDTLTIQCNKEDFQIKGGSLWDGTTLYDLYGEAYTPYEWHEALFKKAQEVGITLFSTPFDDTAVDLLESLDTPAYKIASFEMIDHALLKRVAQTGKPIIMSTGMATLEEITESVAVLDAAGCRDFILLHCVSSYPTPMEQANVRTVVDIAERFNVLSGLSDHTPGVAASIAATALGACFIEKHFTLSHSGKSPDASFSLGPEEFETLCRETKAAYAALGSAGYDRKEAEEKSVVFRRSLYVVEDIKQGDLFTKENIRSIRPGFGLPPKHIDGVLGKRAIKNIERGTSLSWDLVETKVC